MLTFAAVDRQIESTFGVLVARPGLGQALRQYRSSGGADVRPWEVSGILAYLSPDYRLVLEALYVATQGTCAIRVYAEELPTIYYGKKAGSLIGLEATLREAAQVFQLRLPSVILPVQDHDPGLEFPEYAAALVPLPPPVLLSELEER